MITPIYFALGMTPLNFWSQLNHKGRLGYNTGVGCVPIYVLGEEEGVGGSRCGGTSRCRLDHISSTDFLCNGERCSKNPKDMNLPAANAIQVLWLKTKVIILGGGAFKR